MSMTPEVLAGGAGILVSLACSYIPGLAPRWDAVATEMKRLIMLGLMVLISAAVYGAACAGWATYLGVSMTCDTPGLFGLLKILALAAIANQGIYGLSPKAPYARAQVKK